MPALLGNDFPSANSTRAAMTEAMEHPDFSEWYSSIATGLGRSSGVLAEDDDEQEARFAKHYLQLDIALMQKLESSKLAKKVSPQQLYDIVAQSPEILKELGKIDLANVGYTKLVDDVFAQVKSGE